MYYLFFTIFEFCVFATILTIYGFLSIVYFFTCFKFICLQQFIQMHRSRLYNFPHFVRYQLSTVTTSSLEGFIKTRTYIFLICQSCLLNLLTRMVEIIKGNEKFG